MGNVILGLLLMHGPQTIYSLSRLSEQGVSLFYRGGLGSLRGGLQGLLTRGEVEFAEHVDRGRRKKTYRPTPAGVEAFSDWMRAPIAGADVETAALSKLFFLGLVEDAQTRVDILDGIVERIRDDADRLDALAVKLDSLPAPDRALLGYQRAALAYGQGAHRFGLAHFESLRDAEESRNAQDER